jgi:trans-2,3-dihydro-3-hydroxyanthranilate isomerase
MELAFHTLDVFTDTRFAGNPLAVVHGADALEPARMQRIAREFNLSETVFLLKAENSAHSAKVRIFTPGTEVPFAGHPTVGTAVLLAELRAAGDGRDSDSLVVLEQRIGVVRIGVRIRAGRASFAEFDAPKLPESSGDLPATERLAGALGLIPSEIGFENHKPAIYTAGLAFAFVPVASLAALGRAMVNMQHWPHVFTGNVPPAAYLYTRETQHTTSSFRARMFTPALGVPEDPATGSAAAALAGVIQRFDGLPDGTHRRVIEQGFEMGRPSLISLSLEIERGRLLTVRIGGHAVRVSEGRLTL